MITRRHAMGLMASSVLLAGPASATTGVVARKSVNALDPNSPEMTALRSAIPALRQSGFWERMVAIHSRNWRQHHSWLFLPWHRAFLKQFENAVRRLTYDDFRMPYLDWDADRIPAMLYEPPFAHDGRVHGPDDSMRDFQGAGGWFWQSAPRPFADFFGAPNYGGDDESYGHNLVHVFVGGDMGNILSAPRDPLFWFHHSNVDRLWWHWDQEYGCSSPACFPQDWLSEWIEGIEDPDGNVLRPVQVGSLLSPGALGYDYQGSPPMVEMAAPIMQGMTKRAEVAQPVYTRTLRLLSAPAQSITVALPRDLIVRLGTASRAEVDAPLFLRTNSMASHEIRISLTGRGVLQQERIFAMPMGGMGESRYVKNIGGMLQSLAHRAAGGNVGAEHENELFMLRVEAIALGEGGTNPRAELTQCMCKITARTWE
jgi:tyrosinase